MTMIPAEMNAGGRMVGRRGLIAGAAALAAAMATSTGTGGVSATPAATGNSNRDAGTQQPSNAPAPQYAAGAADTLYQNIPGVNFDPLDSASTYGGSVYSGIYATAANSYFSALLDLPQGATITELVFSLFHNDASVMTLALISYDAGVSGTLYANTLHSTQSASTVYASAPILSAVPVDNSRYTYIVRWSSGIGASSSTLYGARVGYTLPSKAHVYGSATSGSGVYGTADTGGYGVQGRATGTSGAALYGSSNNPNVPAFYAVNYAAPTPPNSIAGYFIGEVYVNGPFVVVGGPKSAAVPHPDGTHRLLYCMESPESWFEDFGEGTITAGKAEVKLDPDFAATVDTSKLHVFLTPHDEAYHLAVTNRVGGGFSVSGVPSAPAHAAGRKAGDLNGTFTYRVVAKRKDVTAPRLAKFTPPKALPPLASETPAPSKK